MNLERLKRAIAKSVDLQYRYDFCQSEPKIAAKKRGAEILSSVLPQGAKILDIGGEEFYHKFYAEKGIDVESLNLPDDMHDMDYFEEYDGILASHILEHSPFPLFVLECMKDALKPKGFALIVVPHISTRVVEGAGHLSVLPVKNWLKLIKLAGFKIIQEESGAWQTVHGFIEERILCQK